MLKSRIFCFSDRESKSVSKKIVPNTFFGSVVTGGGSAAELFCELESLFGTGALVLSHGAST